MTYAEDDDDVMLPGPRHLRALRSIVNVLGPEQICDCAHDPDCGLPAEADEALRIAREALGLP